MPTPTQEAEHLFELAGRNLFGVGTHLAQDNQRMGFVGMTTSLQQIAGGLMNLSVGVRQTYQLLEEVRHLLQQQRR